MGAGRGRGTRHLSRDWRPGRRLQSRAAGAAAAAEAVSAAASGPFTCEPTTGHQVGRRDVARPELWEYAVPAEI